MYGDKKVIVVMPAYNAASTLADRFNKAVEQLDSLARAYAAEGKHQQAVQTLQKAIELAGSTDQQNRVRELENRLNLYRSQGYPQR